MFLLCPETDSQDNLIKAIFYYTTQFHENIGIATSHANNSFQQDGELFLYIDKPSEGGKHQHQHRKKRKDTEQAKKGEREKRRYVK